MLILSSGTYFYYHRGGESMDRLENTKEKLEQAKDKAVGKFVETTGKLTNDQGIEFAGKVRQATTKVQDKLYDVKEDVFQEGRKLMDRTDCDEAGRRQNERS
jgi:uncharacterized protein YjbJ (UPF0337 family)